MTLRALLVAAACAGARGQAMSEMSSDELYIISMNGGLSGTIEFEVSEIEKGTDVDYATAAKEVVSAMGCGVPERLFPGDLSAAQRERGLHRMFAAACADEPAGVSDFATLSEGQAAGAAVLDAFAALQAGPNAVAGPMTTSGASGGVNYKSATAETAFLEAGLSISFEGFRPEPGAVARAAAARRLDAAPDDEKFVQQDNYPIMGIEDAWAAFPAAGNADVVVQVVDTGMLMTHEDLQDNLWINPGEVCGDGLDNDGNGYADDCYGYNFADRTGGDDLYGGHYHGTHCAGTIAGTRNNGVGIAGVCGGDGSGDGSRGSGNGCRIMVGTTFGNTATRGFEAALTYGADNGARISSNSWGYTSPGAYGNAMLAAIDYAVDAGVIVVFAAGNSGSDADYYPAYYERAVAVAAVDDNGKAAGFTNYGDWIEISAPGVGVLSTDSGFDSDYATKSGTSFACPTVSGLLGLCLSANPALPNADALECMYANTLKTDEGPFPNSYGNAEKYGGKLGAGVPLAGPMLACCLGDGSNRDGVTPVPAPAPTAAPETAPAPTAAPETCEDDPDWYSKKSKKDCDYFKKKNAKKDWKEKKASKNCKKTDARDGRTAFDACGCDACDKSKFISKSEEQEATVIIVVPVVVAAVLLLGVAAWLVARRRRKDRQHRRSSMPWAGVGRRLSIPWTRPKSKSVLGAGAPPAPDAPAGIQVVEAA